MIVHKTVRPCGLYNGNIYTAPDIEDVCYDCGWIEWYHDQQNFHLRMESDQKIIAERWALKRLREHHKPEYDELYNEQMALQVKLYEEG